MADETKKTYEPSKVVQEEAHVKDMDKYKRLYQQSLDDPEAFWGNIAEQFYFKSKTTGTSN